VRKVPDEVMIGKEPWYADPIIEPNDTRLAWALNWYNYSTDVPVARKWVIEWMRKVGYMADDWASFSKARNDQIPLWICAYSRMMLRGNVLPEYCVERLKDRIADIISVAEHIPDLSEEPSEPLPKPVKRQTKLSDMVADIDDALDRFYCSNYKSFVFDGTTFVKRHDVKPLHARQLVAHFQPLQEEIFKATTKMEGFDHLNQKQLESYRKAVGAFQAFFFRMSSDVKVRKPRKKKVKTPLQLIKDLKFAKANEDLKSIDPTLIIGAKCLWTYNHKYRVLAKIVATDTLSVKGSTIINVDLKESMAKRLRKPNEVLPKVLSGGKPALKNIFKDLKTKPAAFSPRINSDTILLRIT